MALAKVNGVRLYYEASGTGVHGFRGSHHARPDGISCPQAPRRVRMQEELKG